MCQEGQRPRAPARPLHAAPRRRSCQRTWQPLSHHHEPADRSPTVRNLLSSSQCRLHRPFGPWTSYTACLPPLLRLGHALQAAGPRDGAAQWAGDRRNPEDSRAGQVGFGSVLLDRARASVLRVQSQNLGALPVGRAMRRAHVSPGVPPLAAAAAAALCHAAPASISISALITSIYTARQARWQRSWHAWTMRCTRCSAGGPLRPSQRATR